MATPASACPALQCRVAVICYKWSRSTPKCNHLFIGALSTFSENFMQIRLGVFVQSC